MKKLLAIFFICALYAPNAIRLVQYAACTIEASNAQQCDCNLSNVPGDQQSSLPEKQKEILQQANLKYIITEKTAYTPVSLHDAVKQPGYAAQFYSFIFTNSIFHPPGVWANIA